MTAMQTIKVKVDVSDVIEGVEKVKAAIASLKDPIEFATEKMTALRDALEPWCDFNDLPVDQCAGCQGHVGEWETDNKPVIYD